MGAVLGVLTAVLLCGGFLFILFGIVGIIRLPDFYSRLHAQGKCDTLGVTMMLNGLAIYVIYEGHVLTALKILAILFFIALANPTATHALGRAALRSGLKPWKRGEEER